MKTPRKGSVWTFKAVGFDVWDRKSHTPADGTKVRVCQPYGCPKNGTMGHCYVEDMEGQFLGLVQIASLTR